MATGGESVSILLNPRVWIALALAAALAFTHGFAYKTGRAAVRSAWDAEKLALSEKGRLDERARTVANEGVDRAYQLEKQKRLALERVAADRLRDYTAASERADSVATGRADDPRPAIASECAGQLVALDKYASKLAGQVGALQAFTERVCLGAQ